MSATTTQKFSDVWAKAKSGGCFLEPGGVYDLGETMLPTMHGSGIYIGVDERYKDQAKPTLLFHPDYQAMPATFDPTKQGQTVVQAFQVGGEVTIAHLNFQGTGAGQLLLADQGSVFVNDVTIVSGAGLATMRGAELLDVCNLDGVANANMIYTGGSCGLLRMRNCNLRGGMVNEHGLRTHGLDELDWNGGTFDGSGSLQGKDVLTIHEIVSKGLIQNVAFKGWGTIGGLKPDSPGDNTKQCVNNLTLRNVTFSPCNRSNGQANGSQMYVLAGVNNLLWDGGVTVASNGSCVRWTNDGSSQWRKPPTGEIANVVGTGGVKDEFVSGEVGVLKYKGCGNVMNGKGV